MFRDTAIRNSQHEIMETTADEVLITARAAETIIAAQILVMIVAIMISEVMMTTEADVMADINF